MKGLASIPTFLWMKRGLAASARQSLGCSPAQPIPAGFDDSFSKALLNSGRSHFEHRRHLFCSNTRKWSRRLSGRGWVANFLWRRGCCRRNAWGVHRDGRWGKPGSQVWVSPRRVHSAGSFTSRMGTWMCTFRLMFDCSLCAPADSQILQVCL